jgi:cytochrome c553
MTKIFKYLLILIITIPPLLFFVNWRVDSAVQKAVESSKITQPISIVELYAGKCALCHGASGEGIGTAPRINQLSKDELTAKIISHKSIYSVNPVIEFKSGTITNSQVDAISSFVPTMKIYDRKN